MIVDTKVIFENRLIEFEEKENYFIEKHKIYSIARTVVFLLGFGGLIGFANFNLYNEGLLFFFISVIVFLIILISHLKIIASRNHFSNLIKINKTEINLLNNNFTDLDEGLEFLDVQHIYSSDLDIFGKKSLFQFLNRTNTFFGKSLLANWLKSAAQKNTILNRQESIKEISPLIDWRQDFQAIGMKNDGRDKNVILLINAVVEDSDFLKKNHFALPFRFILPAITALTILGSLFLPTLINSRFIFLSILLNSAYLAIFKKDIFRVRELSSISSTSLNSYRDLFLNLEKQNFNHPHLKFLQNTCKEAGKSISALTKIVQGFNNTLNVFYAFIANFLWLSDFQNTVKFEKWKLKIKPELEDWFNALAEMEALCSLAAVHYSQTDWVFPQISDNDFEFNTVNMAHPLINKNKRINNNLELDGIGKTIIITGSNMSGKSTFQRTVGINFVLAQAGSVVCADSFKCSLMQIFTSMRTNDNLEENISSFYAELKRIKQLLDLLDVETKEEGIAENSNLAFNNNNLPVLYLLDEILKGTNSRDRHSGAKSLIIQLGKKKASGFISTHDLELGDMAEKNPEKIENYSFNSEIIDDEIIFDYKIQKGICRSFNATKLMEKMGIEIC